ncbi:MAG: SPOR domain-containing protein [Pyrinomonadaceae bacterium]
MRKCPKCDRSYSDETLNFCLDDGAVLFSAGSASTSENIIRPTERKTEVLSQEAITEQIDYENRTSDHSDEKTEVISSGSSENSQPQIIKQGVSPVFAYLSVGLLCLLLLITAVGITYVISSNPVETTESNKPETPVNSNDVSLTVSDLDLPENVSNRNTNEIPTPQKKIIEKGTPKVDKEKPEPVPTATSTQTPSPAPTESPQPEKGKYYVILGSYQDAQNAQRRLRLARSKGLPARIVNTNNVPGLRSGLQAVVIGPFSRSEARKILAAAKTVSSDAYIKKG